MLLVVISNIQCMTYSWRIARAESLPAAACVLQPFQDSAALHRKYKASSAYEA